MTLGPETSKIIFSLSEHSELKVSQSEKITDIYGIYYTENDDERADYDPEQDDVSDERYI